MKIILALCLILMSCTSDEKKLEELAVVEATKVFQSELKEELAKSITGKDKMRFTAVDIITKRTDFAIQKKNVAGTTAEFEISARTIPVKVRIALIEIMADFDPAKEARFNVSDAILLTTKKLGLSPEERAAQTYKLNFKKQGEWTRAE